MALPPSAPGYHPCRIARDIFRTVQPLQIDSTAGHIHNDKIASGLDQCLQKSDLAVRKPGCRLVCHAACFIKPVADILLFPLISLIQTNADDRHIGKLRDRYRL